MRLPPEENYVIYACPASSLSGMPPGAGIGAIAFSDSIIAFAKLDGRMSGKPILLPARHLINIARHLRHAGA